MPWSYSDRVSLPFRGFIGIGFSSCMAILNVSTYNNIQLDKAGEGKLR
jgi:hypothetical protein